MQPHCSPGQIAALGLPAHSVSRRRTERHTDRCHQACSAGMTAGPVPQPSPGADSAKASKAQHLTPARATGLPDFLQLRARPSLKQATYENTTYLGFSSCTRIFQFVRLREMPQLSRCMSTPVKHSTASPKCQAQVAWHAASKHMIQKLGFTLASVLTCCILFCPSCRFFFLS